MKPETQTNFLVPSPCAICEAYTEAVTLHAANFSAEHLNAEVFSARRLPDRVHYQMRRCKTCGLVRSDPIASPEHIQALYKASTFTYTSEIESLKATYGNYLQSLDAHGANYDSLLDVGCGNGFFLETAQALGYRQVWGVEPSADAIAKAPPSVQSFIQEDVFRVGLFPSESLGVICFFQVLDHFPDPNAALSAAFEMLKPGGLVLAINHDVEALSAKILGSRSPIVDIEHTYLYSKTTQSRLFIKHGFEVVTAFDVKNVYPLHYWLQLFPLPTPLKRNAISLSKLLRVGYLKIGLKPGNQGIIARKPL